MAEKQFSEFKKELENFLKSNKIEAENIYSVSLNDVYWITFEDFMNLKMPPRVWNSFSKTELNSWTIPAEFNIMLRDFRWITYYTNWGDEFYSSLMLHTPPKKATKKYFENKSPTNLTLFDFVKKQVPKLAPKSTSEPNLNPTAP